MAGRPLKRCVNGVRVTGLITATVLALVLPFAATFAAAQQPLAVNGHVANGTAGASAPESLTISLFAFTADAIEASWETQADEAGFFRFDGVSTSQAATLALLVDYQDVTYSARVSRGEGQVVVSQDLTIYESVAVDPGIRFDQTALVVADDPARSGALSITEIHSIVNPTDRAFAPRADGPGGPSGLLVFGLPIDAFDLTPGLGLDRARIVQIGRGFASFAPVIPGRTEVSYSYRLGYAKSSILLERTIRYPVDVLRAITPSSGPEVSSPQLPTSDVVTIGDRQHRTVTGGPFVPGTVLVLSVSGLNVPGGILASVPPLVPASVGTFLGLLTIGVYWIRSQRMEGQRPLP